jgi:DNA-binding FrmR family transcriptional regulator
MNSLMAEVLEGHVREHAFAGARRGSKDAEAAEDVIAVVRTYLK